MQHVLCWVRVHVKVVFRIRYILDTQWIIIYKHGVSHSTVNTIGYGLWRAVFPEFGNLRCSVVFITGHIDIVIVNNYGKGLSIVSTIGHDLLYPVFPEFGNILCSVVFMSSYIDIAAVNKYGIATSLVWTIGQSLWHTVFP